MKNRRNKNSMIKNTMKLNKLAIAVLALSLGQAANAQSTQNETDHTGSYWGLGIGSVIGAVIAGPPGAAIGATLGGSIGWGRDKDQALDQSLVELEKNDQVLGQVQVALHQNKSKLLQTKEALSDLSRANAQQSIQLANLKTQETGDDAQTNATLQGVIGHYAQEIYFRNGESDVPIYAEARLDRLTKFLKSHPNLQVLLKGYTDQRGTADFNTALAQARVDGIKEALLAQGVEAIRVTTQAIGETTSQLSNNDSVADASGYLPNSSIVISGSIDPIPDSGDVISDSNNYVLDRRVSIELSISDKAMQPVASIEADTL
jgi:outer membrane protein OmpA-like peptidoglycan-associated protein